MIDIGKKSIGNNSPCYITLEAGPTIDGFESAKKLIEVAANSKADAIKFQILNADELVADKAQLFEYEILTNKFSGKTKTINEPLFDILKRRELTDDEWKELKKVCDSYGIEFFATIFSEHHLELINRLGASTVKIASSDINHIPLIVKAAQTGMCVQLDTGNASYGEINFAIKKIEERGNNKIIIHHCPTGYPAHLDNVQLSEISKLKKLFPYPIAFSDHTPGWHMNIAAVCMGANMIEKTITLDRTTPSVEHMFSLEEKEATVFVGEIREVEQAIKDTERKLNPDFKKRYATRRSIFSKSHIQKGTKIMEEHLEYRRPGFGLGPERLDDICSKMAKIDIPAGTMIGLDQVI